VQRLLAVFDATSALHEAASPTRFASYPRTASTQTPQPEVGGALHDCHFRVDCNEREGIVAEKRRANRKHPRRHTTELPKIGVR
jgi:hypothetical protein